MSEVGSGMNIGSDYSGTETIYCLGASAFQRKNAERPVNCWCDGSQHT